MKCDWCSCYLTNSESCLSPEQKYALGKYAEAEGRTWKSKLAREWENGQCSGLLQQVRNIIGPSGLVRLTTKLVLDYKHKKDRETCTNK